MTEDEATAYLEEHREELVHGLACSWRGSSPEEILTFLGAAERDGDGEWNRIRIEAGQTALAAMATAEAS